jgi:hypothetical protein
MGGVGGLPLWGHFFFGHLFEVRYSFGSAGSVCDLSDWTSVTRCRYFKISAWRCGHVRSYPHDTGRLQQN